MKGGGAYEVTLDSLPHSILQSPTLGPRSVEAGGLCCSLLQLRVLVFLGGGLGPTAALRCLDP